MILRSASAAGIIVPSRRLTNSNWRKHSMRTLVLMTILGASLYADDDQSKGCSTATIKGTYGYTITGSRPVPTNPGQTETIIGVGVRDYDGMGNFTQVDTTKGALAGAAVDVKASGTYAINPDCTGTAFLAIPGPPIRVVETRLVVVRKGEEIRWIVLSPAPVMVSGHAVRR